MLKKDELLQKAKAHSLAAHFTKAASHHDKMSDHHEKCMKAHAAHAEHHESMMGKAEDAGHSHHKASAAFHKSMAGHHEKLHKSHSTHADHMRKMSEACKSEDTKKVIELLELTEIPESELTEDPVTKAAEVTPTTQPAATPAAATPTTPAVPVVSGDLNENIKKALENKLTEGVNAALERVLNSEEFNKKLDNEIAGKLLEKLGSSTVPTEVKTFPVPRPGTNGTPANVSVTPAGKASGPINMEGVDLELQDLCKVEA